MHSFRMKTKLCLWILCRVAVASPLFSSRARGRRRRSSLRHFHVNRENWVSQTKQVSLHLLIFVNLISLLLRTEIDRMQLDHHPRLCFMNLHSSFPFLFGFFRGGRVVQEYLRSLEGKKMNDSYMSPLGIRIWRERGISWEIHIMAWLDLEV